jgi:hypothetical protein
MLMFANGTKTRAKLLEPCSITQVSYRRFHSKLMLMAYIFYCSVNGNGSAQVDAEKSNSLGHPCKCLFDRVPVPL